MSQRQPLSTLVEQLVDAIEALEPLPGQFGGAGADDPRERVLLALRTKVLPELLVDGDLPVFVAVAGGANVGKSTVFNALAGKLLSPAVIQASATKHPLAFLHERWRRRFLEDSAFVGLTCVELDDPKALLAEPERTDLFYLRFHRDATLEEVALIDSPDFDSALETNATVARWVGALADVMVFVVTAQKYRDREIVARLRALQALKAKVLLVFNMVDEPIVFETLWDDLEPLLLRGEERLEPVHVPRSASQHPEEELREPLRDWVFNAVAALKPRGVKQTIVERTLAAVLDDVRELGRSFEPDFQLKGQLVELLEAARDEEIKAYRRSFQLAYPEETLAIQRILAMTELGPRLRLPGTVRAKSSTLGAISGALERASAAVRHVLVQISRPTEGSLEDSATAVADYVETRNQTDLESIQRAAERLRVRVETFCRDNEERSALAREVVASFFTAGRQRELVATVTARFERVVGERLAVEEDILGRTQRWEAKRPALRNGLFLAALALKLGAGVALAWVLPPSGILSVLNLLWLVLGYLLGAYGIAWLVSLLAQRKARWKEARVKAAREILDEGFAAPLTACLERLLCRERLEEIERTVERIKSHAEFKRAAVAATR